MVTMVLIDHTYFLWFEEKIEVLLNNADKRFFEMRILLLGEMSKLLPVLIAVGGADTSTQWQYQSALLITF